MKLLNNLAAINSQQSFVFTKMNIVFAVKCTLNVNHLLSIHITCQVCAISAGKTVLRLAETPIEEPKQYGYQLDRLLWMA